MGLEPIRRNPHAPQTCASASSATSAKKISLHMKRVSIALSSRAVASQVLSAQVILTTVFGMGTGGPSPLKTLTTTRYILSMPCTYLLYSFVCCVSIKLRFPLNLKFHWISSGTSSRADLFALHWLREVAAHHMGWCTFRDSNPGPTD